jgi:hypothetical protein
LQVIVVGTEIRKIFSAFVEPGCGQRVSVTNGIDTRNGLFGKLSPDGNFFLYDKIFECLRNEGHFLERLAANGTWRRAQGVQPIYTGFTPCRAAGIV